MMKPRDRTSNRNEVDRSINSLNFNNVNCNRGKKFVNVVEKDL